MLDAVIGGWTAPRGAREHFGSLLLGLYEGDKLRFIGHVGSGFDSKKIAAIMARAPASGCRQVPIRVSAGNE